MRFGKRGEGKGKGRERRVEIGEGGV